MKKWVGAAGLCINKRNEILMVKQGRPDERKTWSIPSGGKKENETAEQCCVREFSEETGYDVRIGEELFVKQDTLEGYDVEVHYFRVEIIGGKATIQDPDQLIYEIEWKSRHEIDQLDLTYEGDRSMLIRF